MEYRDRTASPLGAKFKEPASRHKPRGHKFKKASGLPITFVGAYPTVYDQRLGHVPRKPKPRRPAVGRPEHIGGTVVNAGFNLSWIRLATTWSSWGKHAKTWAQLGVAPCYVNRRSYTKSYTQKNQRESPAHVPAAVVLRVDRVDTRTPYSDPPHAIITFEPTAAGKAYTIRFEKRLIAQSAEYSAALALASRLHNLDVLVAFRSAENGRNLYTMTEGIVAASTLSKETLVAAYPAFRAFLERAFAVLAHRRLRYKELSFATCGYLLRDGEHIFRLKFPQNVVADAAASPDGWKGPLRAAYSRMRPPDDRGRLFVFNTDTRPKAGPGAVDAALDRILAELV